MKFTADLGICIEMQVPFCCLAEVAGFSL